MHILPGTFDFVTVKFGTSRGRTPPACPKFSAIPVFDKPIFPERLGLNFCVGYQTFYNLIKIVRITAQPEDFDHGGTLGGDKDEIAFETLGYPGLRRQGVS